MHERISIHQMCFASARLPDYIAQCRQLGTRLLGFTGPALLAPGGFKEARSAVAGGEMAVETVAHVFRAGHLDTDRKQRQSARDDLSRLIDHAAALGARSIYMLTGGHGQLSWEEAADCFAEAIAPCVDQARSSGVALAVENASALYAELHIAHTLADTIRLAELAEIGVCIELFFCWAEAGLPQLFEQAMPRCVLVQLSDYVYGDRSLPARAVPGDGAIPLQRLIGLLLAAGYGGAFDLELLGPRIEAEGAAEAVARAAAHVGGLLAALKA